MTEASEILLKAAAQSDGWLYPSGFLPFFGTAETCEQAVEGLCYILQQIQADRTYRPNIGQTNAAETSLVWAIRKLSADHVRAQLSASVADLAKGGAK